MHLRDFDAECQLDAEEELQTRLRATRRGDFGAFILWHADGGPSLWIHVNKDRAYLHFFPDRSGDHPGFQSSGGPTNGDDIRFLQTDGSDADSITVPRSAVIPVQEAYAAASEFWQKNERPRSIRWLEL